MSSNPNPDFSLLCLSPDLIKVTQELGFTTPTPIQAESIPLLLKGKDLIGQAKTGSGKTAAFALPILEKLDVRDRRVQGLILCPTRELCTQVAREIRKLGRRHPGLQVLILSGGAMIGPQFAALETGVHIVVGTPGRVIDHLKRKTLHLGTVATVVLDEADRMLEMGFQDDVERILSQTPKNRQTVLFSATFPKTIEALSSLYQRSPVRVTVSEDTLSVAAIRQIAFEVDPPFKSKALVWVIHQNEPESVIVFCNLKTTVIELTRQLTETGMSVAALHGDLEQSARDKVMARFRNRSVKILVATDVAARGIDVESLDAVINFDLPAQPEIYVHRIGRTGRAGKKGLAVSLYSPREKPKIESIEKYSGCTLQRKTTVSMEHLDVKKLEDRITSQAPMQTLYISGGRKDKMRPGDVLGALTGEAGGLQGSQIGKIEIHDRFTYVAVAAEIAQLAVDRLRKGRIKGKKFRIDLVN